MTRIGDCKVVLTDDNRVLVFKGGRLIKDQCRSFFYRTLAYRYYDKIVTRLERMNWKLASIDDDMNLAHYRPIIP